jgi:lysocardiolipin and lysophospholipid acyltransferase
MTFSLFSPTSITITTPSAPHTSLPLSSLVVHDPRTGEPVALDLPKNLIIMSNHQAYLDWMVIWFMGYISVVSDSEDIRGSEAGTGWKEHGHGARSVIIILKKQLKKLPIAGWGM